MNSVAKPITAKRERIERKRNSVYSLTEQIQLKYYGFLQLFNRHSVGILFAVLLLGGASIVHTLSTSTILEIFFPDENRVILFCIGLMVSVGLESLSVYLYSEHNDFLSHLVSFVSIGMILAVSFNEFYSNGVSWYSSLLRGGLGSVFLIGSLAIASNIRSIEDSKKRVPYTWLPFSKRRNLVSTIKNLSEEHRNNFRDLANSFKVTSTSLRDLLIKHNKYSSKYLAQLPARRNRRKRIV